MDGGNPYHCRKITDRKRLMGGRICFGLYDSEGSAYHSTIDFLRGSMCQREEHVSEEEHVEEEGHVSEGGACGGGGAYGGGRSM